MSHHFLPSFTLCISLIKLASAPAMADEELPVGHLLRDEISPCPLEPEQGHHIFFGHCLMLRQVIYDLLHRKRDRTRFYIVFYIFFIDGE